jgi:predicted ATPase/DNA-binding winged helix-turn-helix (wHTH) protein
VSIPLRFGNVEVRPSTRELLIGGQPAAVGARAFDLLLALLERRDRMVTKNELLELVWPNLVVEENNLQVHISSLRKLLGPQAIKTIPGRGYRLAISIDEPGSSGSVTAAQPAAVPTPKPSVLAPRLTNLPDLLPSLYGRAPDIAQIRALLADHRVVSIVGAGGIGKTRLAQAVAGELRSAYADGVWWVELAALSDGELVADEVARVLGVPLGTDRPAVDSIANILRSQSLLLLLDNCEHLLKTVAALVDAVSQAASGVRVLVTSQEPLKILEETVYRLNTLAIPSSSGLDEAKKSGAVQLFVSRAQAADPRFVLTADNADAVADICKRLDGIPLALELAAARLPLLGVEGLRAKLDERLQVLTGGSRFVLRRHQTLRAALDFSHGLLSPDEQAVFRRIGVFVGSFALESAQDVVSDEKIDTWATLDHLGTLVDKSILIPVGSVQPRLRLLETTRAYALEKLADASETPRMLERHAHATARLFARANKEFWNLSDDAWLARYEPELDNLRAALAWSLRNEPEVAIALAGDSRPLWLELALQPEASLYCEAALALVSDATPQRAAGRLWHARATMLVNTRPMESRDAAARAVELLRNADDPATLAAALMALAFWSNAPPDQQQANALDELRRLDNPQWPARMRLLLPNASAGFHLAAGRYADARHFYELTREIAAACGATQFELASQENAAESALIIGDLDFAVAALRDVADRLALMNDRLFHLYAVGTLATALLFRADPVAARQALAQAVPLIVRYGLGFRYAATAALLAAHEGRWEASAQLLGYGAAAAAAHGVDAHRPTEVMARDQALQRLAAHARPDELEAWRRQGSSLSVEDAYRLALALS